METMSFKEYCESGRLDEKALIIGGDGNRTRAYPRENNVLILAGGTGSGKSFVLEKFVAFEGKTLNSDNVTEKILRLKPKEIKKKFEDMTGRYLESINLKNPGDAAIMHEFLEQTGLAEKESEVFFRAAASSKNKPNVILNTTLSSLRKIDKIGSLIALGGVRS